MTVRSLSPRILGEPEHEAQSVARPVSIRAESLRVHSEPDEAGDEPSGTVRVAAGSPEIRWVARGPAKERLLVDGALPIAEWLAAGRLSVVKQGPHRVVYRLSGKSPGDEAVYVKRFECRSWRDLVANALRGSRARLEWTAAGAVAAAGIPTIAPVLLGEENRSLLGWTGVGTGFLVTPEIAESEPLDALLEQLAAGQFSNRVAPRKQVAFRQWLARALGDVAGRLHAVGILHPDLHAGNLLVTGNAPGDWQLWLIDLHALQQTRGLSDLQRQSNIAELARFFLRWATRVDRARFLRAYRHALPVEYRPENRTADLLERMAFEAALERGELAGAWRTDAAWRRGNRHVARRDGDGVCCRALASSVGNGTSPEWLDDWRAEPLEWVAARRIAWCKQSVRRQVAAIRGEEIGGHPVVFAKRMVRSSWLERVSDLLRTPIARHAWLVGHELLRRGIPTPSPLAYLARRAPDGNGGEQWLLTAGIADTTTVAAWLDSVVLNAAEEIDREQIATVREHMATAVARLHRWGYDHRDLKFANWLVQPETGAVWLLDLDAVRRRSVWWSRLTGVAALGRSRRVQNLSRLAVSAGCYAGLSNSDRLRFLRTYLARSGERVGRSGWKAWWREIAARVGKKLRQNVDRGRPLS
jgi:tRNA A-37 threonylcarbamoyl transferase component Bud32